MGKARHSRGTQLLVSCEHASPHVPARFAPLFQDARPLLSTHRAFDQGALGVARALATAWECPLITGEVTRLLIDLNRSYGNRGLYSEFTRQLPRAEKRYLLERYYLPYRQRIFAAIAEPPSHAPVIHLSVHSFTPSLDGKVRNTEVGLLFDPARTRELRIAEALRTAFLRVCPTVRVRFNYPYRGTSDGLTQSLRGWLANERYAGIEVEFNQGCEALWRRRAFQTALARAWAEALAT
ncbi:MAG: N-formylglutamate amidohydrolase [Polyangiaceae bacterium]|nr:N-formylglutamate amidohydrolase [Polyangiaceae bacterium]